MTDVPDKCPQCGGEVKIRTALEASQQSSKVWACQRQCVAWDIR